MRTRLAQIAIAALIVLPLAAQTSAHAALGTELAPNTGFEASPTDPTGATTHQPLLPTGWLFEGAAGLFDHSENGAYAGKRMAAISAPAATPDDLCQQGMCVDNPLNAVQDATSKYYSLSAYWRTQAAVPVTANASYVFSVVSAQTLATERIGGAVTKVRWIGADGLPISETVGATHIQAVGEAPETTWAPLSATVKAPAGATGAILMLGAADDLFISQIKYDNVSFRKVL
jgi:hypothetical protein